MKGETKQKEGKTMEMAGITNGKSKLVKKAQQYFTAKLFDLTTFHSFPLLFLLPFQDEPKVFITTVMLVLFNRPEKRKLLAM